MKKTPLNRFNQGGMLEISTDKWLAQLSRCGEKLDLEQQYDQHVHAFRWHQRVWMEREYRHGGEWLS